MKVTSAELKGNRGVFELTFDDARMLTTSKFFENVQVLRSRTGRVVPSR